PGVAQTGSAVATPAGASAGAAPMGDASAQIRTALRAAVQRQLMSDVPYGVLLSGGLDSSIIAATAKSFVDRRVEEDGRAPAWWPRLHTFSIGLEGSPDLAAAREVAQHIDSVHHEFHFTVEEGIDALEDVVYHLETYDVTTIRAAVPMYLMARRIRAMGVKMVLSGEGADEIFGGYLYFHRAPDARSLHEETVRKLDRLHMYDCLRANKAMAAWGVEARVPFLDREFLDVAMSIPPALKLSREGRMEKHVLREAFAPDLPPGIVWRQKEQFSDGVGYGWIDSLRALAAREVSADAMANARFTFPHNTPATPEAYFYRTLFARHFPHDDCARCVPGGSSVACSTPEALAWDPSLSAVIDPSGRAVRGVHGAAYEAEATPAGGRRCGAPGGWRVRRPSLGWPADAPAPKLPATQERIPDQDYGQLSGHRLLRHRLAALRRGAHGARYRAGVGRRQPSADHRGRVHQPHVPEGAHSADGGA